MSQEEAQKASNQAHAELRTCSMTVETVFNLVLLEAGLAIVDGSIRKVSNVHANLGMRPELAIARVVARHLGADI